MIFAIFKHKFLCFKPYGDKVEAVCDGVYVESSKTLIFYFLNFVLFIFILLASSAQARVLNKENTESGHFKAEFLYQALAAEIYREMGDEVLAVEQYQRLALESKDPAISRRVTILAAATGQLPRGLKVAERWVALTPEDLEARQYLALLYLRNNKIVFSSVSFNTWFGRTYIFDR